MSIQTRRMLGFCAVATLLSSAAAQALPDFSQGLSSALAAWGAKDPSGAALTALLGGSGAPGGTAGLGLGDLSGALRGLGLSSLSDLDLGGQLAVLKTAGLDPGTLGLAAALPTLNLPSLTSLPAFIVPTAPKADKASAFRSRLGGVISRVIDDGLGGVETLDVQKLNRWGRGFCLAVLAARKGVGTMPPDGEKNYAVGCKPSEDFEQTLDYLLPLGPVSPLEQSRLAASDLRKVWQTYQDTVFWGLEGAINAGGFPVLALGSSSWDYYFYNCTAPVSDPLLSVAQSFVQMFDPAAVPTSRLPTPPMRYSTTVGGLKEVGAVIRPPGLSDQAPVDDLSIGGVRASLPMLDSMSPTCAMGYQDWLPDVFNVFTPSFRTCVMGTACVDVGPFPDVQGYSDAVPRARLEAACAKVIDRYSEYVAGVGASILRNSPNARWWSNPFQGAVVAPVFELGGESLANLGVLARAGGSNPLYPLYFAARTVLKQKFVSGSFLEKVQQGYALLMNALWPSFKLVQYPGFAPMEEAKRWLAAGDAFSQRTLGYSSFYEAFSLGGVVVQPRVVHYNAYSIYTDFEWVYTPFPVLVPFVSFVNAPQSVPGVLIAPGGYCKTAPTVGSVVHAEDRVGYDWVSVAEGYPIPRVWTEFDDKKRRAFLPGVAGLSTEVLQSLGGTR